MKNTNKNRNKNIEAIYPLSPMQRGMLFHSLYAPETGVYFTQLSCVIEGDIDLAAFERAWQWAVDRHQALRAAFVWDRRDKPLQVIYRKAELPIERQDWRGLSSDEQQQRLDEMLSADRRRGFNLAKAPLMRLCFVRLAGRRYRLIWSHHHLLIDGWSLPLVLKDVFACYDAYSRGRELTLPQPRPYRDYITWLQQQNLADAESYWTRRLEGFTRPTVLGIDRRIADANGSPATYAEERLRLNSQTTAALSRMARQHQLTLSTIVQGAWGIVISRYSGERDVLFGAVVSGRPAEIAGVDSIVGLFINTLPVRMQVNGDGAVIEWLKEQQAEQIELRQFEYSPLTDVQGWSEVDRGSPLFESIFIFENYPTNGALAEDGRRFHVTDVSSFEQVNYPLTVVAAPGEELSIRINYDCSRFHGAAVARLLAHLERVLETFIEFPESRICEVEVLSDDERRRILMDWNSTEQTYSRDRLLHELFEDQVDAAPDATAVFFEDQQLTYAQLNEHANRLAHYLIARGAMPDSRIALCAERSVEMIVGLLAILKSGSAYLPLDVEYPAERLRFMLEDSQSSLLLTQRHLLGRIPVHAAQIICIDQAYDFSEESIHHDVMGRSDDVRCCIGRDAVPRAVASGSPCDPRTQTIGNPRTQTMAGNAAYVIYTSGSTGLPKGVVVSHRAILNTLEWRQSVYPLAPGDRLIQKIPIGFDPSVWELFAPLLAGATLVVARPGGHKEISHLVELIATHDVSTVQFPPSMLPLLLDEQRLDKCRSLKQVICGGEALPYELKEEFLSRLDARIDNLYGPTEAALDVTYWRCDRGGELRTVPIGKPISNVQTYLLDSDLQPAPIGVPGELCVGGEGLARGYLNRPELSAERFIANPFSENRRGTRLYRTGDLARYLDDGAIEFLGRLDNQVKIRGFRIETGEIEAVLGQHPLVREAAVIAGENNLGEKRLIGYVVPREEAPADTAALKSYLAERLPEYMVPAVFVMLNAMPLTTNGKIDRRALPAPDDSTADAARNFVAPRTAIEEVVAGIWSKVLGVQRVGVTDNFFELGGHSLLATQVTSRVREALKVDLPLRSLFETPTVAAIANLIEVTRRAGDLIEAPPIARATRDGELPLSFAQQRLWFIEQLGSSDGAYNMPAAIRLSGAVSVDSLSQSFNEIIRRHESLRGRFVTIDGRAVQIISDYERMNLELIDLTNLAGTEAEAAAKEFAVAHARQPFDLATGPLLRANVVRIAPGDHVLLVSVHHIVSDGWSVGLLVRELAELFSAYSSGTRSPLPELVVQYPDFALWQRDWLRGEVLEKQLAYWRKQLAGNLPVLELPSDRPRPPVQTYNGAHYSFVLPVATLDALKEVCANEGVTMFMALAASFTALLHRYSSQDDIILATPIANRNRAEIESLIGFFANTLVLRTQLSPETTFKELLAKTREVSLDAYAHQDVPFEKLVEELQPERDLSRLPLFQVVFTLQNAPMSDLQLTGLTLSPMMFETGTAKFDLHLTVQELPDGLAGTLEYNTDLFDEVTVHRFAGHLHQLLEAVINDREQQLWQIPILKDDERRQLLEEWNNPEKECPVAACLHELFESRAEHSPDRIAAVYEGEELTYEDLNERANQLAQYLRLMGIGPETRVAMRFERSLDMIVALVAVLKTGAAYVPIDLEYPADRVAFMLEDAATPVLLTRRDLVESLPENCQARIVCLDADKEIIESHSCRNMRNEAAPAGAAYVIYTSGSTGRPKGVMVTHSDVVRLYDATADWYHFDQHDVWTMFHSFAFDFSVWEIWGALLFGGKLVIPSYLVTRNPDAFRDLLNEQAVTVLNQTPSAFRQLVQAEAKAANPDALALRSIIFGGEALELQSLKPWFERHGDASPQLINMYGITETTVHVTYRPVNMRDVENGLGSVIGTPIPDLQVYVLDRHQQPAPIGVPGELCVGGGGLARGYLNRPQVTAERFIPNPFGARPGLRLYRSGDLARHSANGDLEYLGRIDHQVKIRGFRIELGEIEAALAQFRGINECVVIAREDSPGDRRLVAYVVAELQDATLTGEIRAHLKDRLAEYMIPSAFVYLDTLPLTTNGKVDRRALPAPDQARPDLLQEYVAPETVVEQTLAAIWSEVLGVARIGINDNFFELGGDSIRSIQVRSLAQKAGFDFSITDMFERQTLGELATAAVRLDGESIEEKKIEAFGLISEEDRSRMPEGVEDAYPVTRLQAGMLFHSDYSEESALYHDLFSFHLEAKLEINKLQKVMDLVVSRHPVLRTAFDLTSFSEPLQLVYRDRSIMVEEEDISDRSVDDQQAKIKTWIEEEKKTKMAWQRPGLMRAKVFRRSSETFQFALSLHHAILDGWSLASMLTELFESYVMQLDGREIPDGTPVNSGAPVNNGFRDFVALEYAITQSEEAFDYWRGRLAGSTLMKVPRQTGRSVPRAVASGHQTVTADAGALKPAVLNVPFESDLLNNLRGFAAAAEVPIKTIFLAAHLRVMAALGSPDVTTGLVSNGRPENADGEKALGLFLNTLPFRHELQGGSWLDLARETLAVELRDMPYRRYPLVELQKRLAQPSLFETAFNYTHFHVTERVQKLGGVKLLGADGLAQTNFTLAANFNVALSSSSIAFTLDYNAAELGDDEVAAIGRRYILALSAMSADPASRYDSVCLLDESERRQILSAWNDTHTEYTGEQLIHRRFERQVEKTPDRVALVFEGEIVTYEELNRRSNQLAHYIAKKGAGPEVLAGVCAERSIEMVVSLMAILKAGAAYVPLDPSYPADRLQYMLEDSNVALVLTQKNVKEQLSRKSPVEVISIEAAMVDATPESAGNPDAGLAGNNLAYMIYTSGSTGRPKGAMNTHAGIRNRLEWMQEEYGLIETDRVMQKTPFSFDVSVWEFFWPLIVGSGLVIAKPGGHQDPGYLVGLIEREQVTTMHFVPSMLRAFLGEESLQNCGSLKRVICSGEALSHELKEEFETKLQCELHNLYGPTEAAVDVTVWNCSEKIDGRIVPIGRPIANIRTHVAGAWMEPVAIGVAGELLIGGVGVGRGYQGRAGLTAERFIPDPFGLEPGARLYRTGDLVRYLKSGNIEYLGRLDHQVKVRGFRIELGEIETALEQHPQVAQAAVTAYEERAVKRLVAYIVTTGEGASISSELRAYLKDKLPDYMVPSVFMFLDAMPLNANGKVDRKALPLPDTSQRQVAQNYVAPSTSQERLLAEIWSQVIGVERVGVHDNFFELGGDSILSMQVVAKANQAGLRLIPKQLFERQTISELAAVAGSIRRVVAEQGLVTGRAPLTPIQRWFFEHEPAGQNHFNQAVIVEARRPLNPEVLKQAVARMLDHHDSLRLRFRRDDSGWHQEFGSVAAAAVFEVVDLTVVDDDQLSARIEEKAAQIQASLDLAEGRLIKVVLFDAGSLRSARVLIVIHHLAVDGVSWRILLEDLVSCYERLESGTEAVLPAKTTSFKAWAEHLQKQAQSDAVVKQASVWTAASGGNVAPLPVDFEAGVNRESSARSVAISLDQELTRALLQRVPAVYHTRINDVLLTALAGAFECWTGNPRVLIDLEGHGREELTDEASTGDIDLSRTVGWFTTIYPVLIELREQAPIDQSLKLVKEQLRAIPDGGIGYGLLRYSSSGIELSSRLAESADAEVIFNYLGQIDQMLTEESVFGPAKESSGPSRDPASLRSYLIEVTAVTAGGSLRTTFTYGSERHHHSTIEKLARHFNEALTALIEHCLSAEAGGFTPSDFALARLDQEQVDQIYSANRLLEDIYPLSPVQEGMLFHSLYAPDSGVYCTQLSCRLSGDLNLDAFERAWQEVVDRNSILRTGFIWEGQSRPVQVVVKNAQFTIEKQDSVQVSDDQAQQLIEQLLEQDRREGFDLTKPPLMRLRLLRFADQSCEMIWSHHHLLLDGWSVGLVLKEVAACYQAICRDEQPRLQESKLFKDYIAWLQRQDRIEAESYWRERLSGFNSATSLGLAHRDQIEAYGEARIEIDSDLTAALNRFARECRVTLNTVLQAAWALVLNRYSGEGDLVYGAVVSGRSTELPEVDSMIGLFINTLPVRVRIAPDLLLREWLGELQRDMAELQRYEHSSLADVQAWSDIGAGLPLFESIFVFENYPIDSSLAGLGDNVGLKDIRSVQRTNYPLSMVVAPAERLVLRATHDLRRLDSIEGKKLVNHFAVMLESLVADPARPLLEFDLLTSTERHQLLVEWNKTDSQEAGESLFIDRLDRQVEESPDAIAVVFENSQLTYGGLNERANLLARNLKACGVGPESLVALFVERSVEMIVGIVGTLKAGGAYVPLDPSQPAQRIAGILKEASPRAVLTAASLADRLPETASETVMLETCSARGSAQNQQNLQERPLPANPAYVIYTSGSTGTPKGVVIQHASLANLVDALEDAIYRDQTGREQLAVSVNAPLVFDASVKQIAQLACGRRLHIVPDDVRLDAFEFEQFLTLNQIDVLDCTPSQLRLLSLDTFRPSVVLIGGEAIDDSLMDRIGRQKKTAFYNVYGPTEATVDSTVKRIGFDQQGVTIGRPIRNVSTYVLDKQMRPAPSGVAGELHIGGKGLSRGYLGRPELTAQRFVPDPFAESPGERLYKTGDLVRLSRDGEIEYAGRIDHQIKIRGFRIELGEIEAALARHPSVKDAVVIARDDAPGEKRLIAYIVGIDGRAPSAKELRSHLKEALPDYMTPAAFIILEALPLTPNGKLDRASLPAPDHSRPDWLDSYVPPRTHVEKTLAAIWSEVLRIERVGISDNFFQLGGDSILSIQIVARTNQAGLRITPRHLFTNPTIAELAAVALDSGTIEAEQGLVTGPVPLTAIQRRFFERDLSETHHFNQSVLLETRRKLSAAVLTQAVGHLIKHHDALRMRFERDERPTTPVLGWLREPETLHAGSVRSQGGVSGETGWKQTCSLPDDRAPVEFRNLSAIALDSQAAAIETIAAATQSSLDLLHGPVIKVVLFDLGPERSGRLLIAIHHLVVDGVSWRVILEDLQSLCGQLESGRAPSLGPKTTSFKQWAERIVDLAQSPALIEDAEPWLAIGRNRFNPLAVDFAGENLEVTARAISISVDTETTRSLLQEAPAAYHTRIDEMLLAALAEAYYRWSGESRLLVDLEGHGRADLFDDVDVSRTVGWFTAVYPVALEFDEEKRAGQNLKLIKERVRQFSERGVSYGLLRYLTGDSHIKEELNAQLSAEISFNYMGQVDSLLDETSLFAPAAESCGPAHSPMTKRGHLIEVTGVVANGQLQLSFTYSESVHSANSIEVFAWAFKDALGTLVEHCVSDGAGGFTPSDFPLARLDQEKIDRYFGSTNKIEDVYALSPVQEGMLFHSIYAPDTGVYCTQLSCRMAGDLDVDSFERAWQTVIDRHSTLRASFYWEGLDKPVQAIGKIVRLVLEREDWSGHSELEQVERLERLLEEDRIRGFNLSSAPLMRLTLIKIGEDTYRFVWSHHHLLLDGWSLVLVLKEVLAFYESSKQGRSYAGTQPAGLYRDYIGWLRRQSKEVSELYWRERLKGFRAPTSIGIDRGARRQPEGPQQTADSHFEIQGEAMIALSAMARRRQLTLNTVVQGALALVLSRYSSEEDVLYGTVVAGRPPEIRGIDGIVGLFINTLPVRVTIRNDETVADWLGRLQNEQAEMRQYEYSPLVDVHGWSEIERGLPLFETLFAFENYPVNASLEETRGSIEIDDVVSAERVAYPLTVVAMPGQGLTVRISYDRQRFEADAVERMLGHIQTLIARMSAAPEKKVSDLSMLTEAEMNHVLSGWLRESETPHAGSVRSQREFPVSRCVHGLVEVAAERFPERVAVVFENSTLTYRELNDRANQVAHCLRGHGVGPEVSVGILVDRSIEMVIGLLGILKSGGAYLPLDIQYPPERLAFMLDDAAAPVLLTATDLLHLVPGTTAKIVCLDGGSDLESQSRENPPQLGCSDNTAYVIYTSGSTGKPKGVLVSHANLIRLFDATRSWYEFDESDVWTMFHSQAFDFSVWELWGALYYGGREVVVPYWVSRSPEAFHDLLIREGVTILNQTPSAFKQLIRTDQEQGNRENLALRFVIFGGEALDLQSLRPWFDKHGDASPKLINMYGITETTVHVTYRPIGLPDIDSGKGSVIGEPIPDLRVCVLGQNGEPSPIGISGEMYVGGTGLARGYLNRPELTAERFVPDPFGSRPGARVYKTGDRARQLNGSELEYIGRSDHQVKIRGFRIETGEIEAELLGQPGIEEAIVLVREDIPGDKRLVAYLVVDRDRSPRASDLRNAMKERLPEYMIPSAFIFMDSLPLTSNGKLDRRALPAPEQLGVERQQQSDAPRTQVEEMLAGIWREVLDLDRVGIHDNFFDIGGHSLTATQVVSRIREAFNCELPLRMLFETPDLMALAAEIEAAKAGRRTSQLQPISASVRPERIPLSFAQQRVWFIEELGTAGPMFNLSTAVRLEGALNIAALEQSLNEIIRRHESLRTTFSIIDGQAVQTINESAIVDLRAIDLTGLPSTRGEAELVQLATEESRRPFDLASGPLLKIKLFRLDSLEHALVISMHHIVSDGWSMGVLVKEVAALFEVFSAGTTSPLNELGVQYADFALWQRSWLTGKALDEQLDYWRQQLPSPIPVLELPTDRPRPAVQTHHGARLSFTLSEDVTFALRELGRAEGVTLFMTLLAAFKTLLYRYSGQQDIVVGADIANRNRAEIESLIGFFVNLMVLRTDLSGSPSFRDLLVRVRDVTLGAYSHQDVPFEKLVDELQPERDLSRSPLFQVLFVLQNTPGSSAEMPGLKMNRIDIESPAVQFDLILSMSETEGGMEGSLAYNTDLFDLSTIQKMVERLKTLLESVAADPDQRLSDLRLLSNEETSGYEPSHFPDAGLSQKDFEDLLLEIGG